MSTTSQLTRVHPDEPSAQAADEWVARAAQLPGALTLLSSAGLSELLQRHVQITHLRIKTGHSVVAAWVDLNGQHGSATLTNDVDKFTKALQRAEKVGETLQGHHSDSPWLFSGSVWADPVLSKELRAARHGAAERVGSDLAEGNHGEHWKVLRYNPRRRVVAAVGPAGKPTHVVRVMEQGAQRVLETIRCWRELGVPVTNAKPLGDRGSAVITPLWGTADLVHHPHQPAARSAGAAVARLHAATRLNSPADVHHSDAARLQVLPVTVSDAVNALKWTAPWLGSRPVQLAETVMARLRDAASSPQKRSVRLSPCQLHGDLSPDQVIIAAPQSHKIRLIDLERSGLGNPMRDLGSWAATSFRLELPQLVEPFLHGYAAEMGLEAEKLDLELMSVWEAYSHLSGALDPFRHRDPNWPREVTRAITLAEEALHR